MLLENYQNDGFYDEMFAADGTVRPHYLPVLQHFQEISEKEYNNKQTAVELSFMRGGVTFTVYSDSEGTERIFPFDCVPRVISSQEWDVIERGLIQRITALNLFLHDIYHDQKILRDRTIPAQYILSAKHYRREIKGFEVPKDVYVHICGSDLIRGADGQYLVLEDNLRCPSGASYMLENRSAMKRRYS